MSCFHLLLALDVRQVRAALLELEAREAALEAALRAPKRRRLRGKCSASAYDPPKPTDFEKAPIPSYSY